MLALQVLLMLALQVLLTLADTSTTGTTDASTYGFSLTGLFLFGITLLQIALKRSLTVASLGRFLAFVEKWLKYFFVNSQNLAKISASFFQCILLSIRSDSTTLSQRVFC